MGHPQLFRKEIQDIAVKDIFVQGSDVYLVGYELIPASGTIAKYWKNGSPVNLTDGKDYAFGTSIFVQGNDVYVAGVIQDINTLSQKLVYWKNGQIVELKNGFSYIL
jgi:hypothetical protein